MGNFGGGGGNEMGSFIQALLAKLQKGGGGGAAPQGPLPMPAPGGINSFLGSTEAKNSLWGQNANMKNLLAAYAAKKKAATPTSTTINPASFSLSRMSDWS